MGKLAKCQPTPPINPSLRSPICRCARRRQSRRADFCGAAAYTTDVTRCSLSLVRSWRAHSLENLYRESLCSPTDVCRELYDQLGLNYLSALERNSALLTLLDQRGDQRMIFASAAALLTQPILPRHPPHTCLPLRASRLDFYVSSARNLDAPGLPHAQGTEGWAAQAAGGLAALQANNILISQTSEVRPIAVPRSLLAMCSSHAPVIRKPRAVASHLAMFRATACISYLVAHLVSCLVTCSVSCLVSHPAPPLTCNIVMRSGITPGGCASGVCAMEDVV